MSCKTKTKYALRKYKFSHKNMSIYSKLAINRCCFAESVQIKQIQDITVVFLLMNLFCLLGNGDTISAFSISSNLVTLKFWLVFRLYTQRFYEKLEYRFQKKLRRDFIAKAILAESTYRNCNIIGDFRHRLFIVTELYAQWKKQKQKY